MPTAQIDLSLQQLLQVVEQLKKPEFDEFFLQILNMQSQHKQQTVQSNNFLQAITGIGQSQQSNVSTNVKDILKNEIDPVKGWSLK
jgi:hypothetical protein